MKIKKLKKRLGFIIIVFSAIISLSFLFLSFWIGFFVMKQCHMARANFRGDCVESLSQVIDDESKNIRQRNDAIWALGQFGDRRALSVLEKYYTGKIPPREPLDKTLSQYELRKALNLAKGGVNFPAIVWRGIFMPFVK